MKNLPLDHYSQWPFARKAVIFLKAAKTSNEIINRDVGSWEVSYYLLSHAVELAIKAVAAKETGMSPERTHDKEELALRYMRECHFTDSELTIIRELKGLNNGSGGLRYDNEPQGEFLPSTFSGGIKIVERLLETFE